MLCTVLTTHYHICRARYMQKLFIQRAALAALNPFDRSGCAMKDWQA